MGKKIIEFSDVTIGYGKKAIVENISFSIYENDFVGLVGPNGAGKTTLLRTLLGNLKNLRGEIKRDPLRFGYVPQRDTVQPLLPYTVQDVVMMGRYSLMGLLSKPSKTDYEITSASLEKVGIKHLSSYNYNSLSGGQRQRTLIARALAVEPNILILDEPTNGMDTPSHHSLLNLISELHVEKKLTILLVSHLLSDVANGVKKLILIDKNYFQAGSIEEVLSESNLQKTYNSEFHVNKIDDEYIITSKHRN
ncbi:MAG TPA: metal ABC transporter ATP-binding protein [Ignavibacteriaceae bacterium]|nr:metal ABC transporter ATP-binding protein [Ignavibacteriaceae bacterium]